MASIASSEIEQHDQGQVNRGLRWPFQHPLTWEQQKFTMGKKQHNGMGSHWEILGLLFSLSLFYLFGYWLLPLNWQSCVHPEYKETLQVISNKRHYLGKVLNETGAHSPVQQRLALSEEGAKARKWDQRRVLPEHISVSGKQY